MGLRIIPDNVIRLGGHGGGLRVSGPTSILPLTIDFSVLADGALPSPFASNATWSISSGKAACTPVTIGPTEKVVNRTFDSDTGWGKGIGWSIGSGVATHSPGSASLLYQNNAGKLDLKTWYRIMRDIVHNAGGGLRTVLGGSFAGPYKSTSGTFTGAMRSHSSDVNSIVQQAQADFDGSVDNFSVKAMVQTELQDTLPATQAAITMQCTIAQYDEAIPVGMRINIDSATNPQNFIEVYLYNGNVRLDKCVNGTYTLLVAGVVTWGATKIMKVVQLADLTTYKVYYDGAQVGANTTINEPTINSNTIHGVFGTGPTSTLGSVALHPT